VSVEEKIVPLLPTVTNNVDEVDDVLESESFFAHAVIKTIKMMTPINETNFLFMRTFSIEKK
jgi:hypothetical protein